MTWYSDIDIEWEYSCECGRRYCHVSKEKVEEGFECDCGKVMEYMGFKPINVSIGSKVQFEQNGRQAYRIDTGNGRPSYVSKTKLDYMKTGVAKSGITKEYNEHLKSRVSNMTEKDIQNG